MPDISPFIDKAIYSPSFGTCFPRFVFHQISAVVIASLSFAVALAAFSFKMKTKVLLLKNTIEFLFFAVQNFYRFPVDLCCCLLGLAFFIKSRDIYLKKNFHIRLFHISLFSLLQTE